MNFQKTIISESHGVTLVKLSVLDRHREIDVNYVVEVPDREPQRFYSDIEARTTYCLAVTSRINPASRA